MNDNPAEVLLTLDGHLDHPVRLVLYGRGALQLGFKDPLPEFAATQDVDGIIPLGQLDELENDFAFWDAIDRTNEDLA